MLLSKEAIAIVGAGVKTPAGSGLGDLWNSLMTHDSHIRTVCVDDDDGKPVPFQFASVMPPELRDGFDPKFWGLTPGQASEIDPQTRWIIEGVWNALLDSRSLDLATLAKMTVGVYCGIMNNDAADVRKGGGEDYDLNSSAGSVAGFVAHTFGFQGPALDVNTMCSSGLVALELASQALQAGTIDVAVVAAANWVGGLQTFQNIGSLNALSKSGLQDCLGRSPDGYVRGEAAVTLLLQRVSDVAEGGMVRATVHGISSTHHGRGFKSSINNGGRMSVNTALPKPSSYVDAYKACSSSNEKSNVVYLEMHATGTVLGDKAEIDAALSYYANEDGPPLWIGGNKSMFGHTEPVSGLLSIVKLCLGFEKGTMPPTLFVTDNAEALEKPGRGGRTVDVMLTPMPLEVISGDSSDALFGVTSSGMSGTTSHVLLRPSSTPYHSRTRKENTKPTLMVVTTHSRDSCRKWTRQIPAQVKPEALVNDVQIGMARPWNAAASTCCTLAIFDHSTESKGVAFDELPCLESCPPMFPPAKGRDAAKITLAFGGVGLAKYGVGRRAYREWPSFRDAVKVVDHLFSSNEEYPIFQGQNLSQLCGMSVAGSSLAEEGQLPTLLMQATTFLVQYAEASALLKDFDVKVDAVVGHSFGELVAAVVSGALTLEVGVYITLLRTHVCLELESELAQPMAMALCSNMSARDASLAIEQAGVSSQVFLSGDIAESECLLSGYRAALGDFIEGTLEPLGATPMWVDSDIAFHSPLVADLATKVECSLNKMAVNGLLASPGSICSIAFMTSKEGPVPVEELRTPIFWCNSVLAPVQLSHVMQALETSVWQKGSPLFDLSPRGLYSNWVKRNVRKDDQSHGLCPVVSAPTFSWDFARVLQHFRRGSRSEASEETGSQAGVGSTAHGYPFARQLCKPTTSGRVVRPIGDFLQARSSVFNRKTSLEAVFRPVDYTGMQGTPNAAKIGVDLVCNGEYFWQILWAEEDAERRSIVGFDNKKDFLKEHVFSAASPQKTVMVVMGPLFGVAPHDAFVGPRDLDKALEFVDALQELILKEESPICGLIFVTQDAAHPAFEFIAGGFASMRLQAPGLDFVTTLRIDSVATEKITPSLLQQTLKAAAAGESILNLAQGYQLEACRLLPSSTVMTWSSPAWVKPDCLYVVSGATSALASVLLPFLAGIGIRHFLLLVHRRQPREELLRRMWIRGAEKIIIEHCDITSEECIRSVVLRGVAQSGAKRVAGVFHMAATDDSNTELPIPRHRLKAILSVKYDTHVALLKATDLEDGDIFSIPGSISTIIGSQGIGYVAANHACRALQMQLSHRLVTTMPSLAVSDVALERSSLVHGWDYSKKKMRALTGMLTVPSQAFILAQTSQLGVPSGGHELVIVRQDTQTLHEYLNATSPNCLFSGLLLAEEEESIVPVEKLIARAQTSPSGVTIHKGQDETTAGTAEQALLAAIAEVTALPKEEVAQAATSGASLDDAFSIDSISSIRLKKRLENKGYTVLAETLVSSTIEAILEHMEAIPQVQTGSIYEEEEAQAVHMPDAVQLLEDRKLGRELSYHEVPVSASLGLKAAKGHNIATGGIVPSLWYLMNGAILFPNQSVKMTLHRMSALEAISTRIFLLDQDQMTLSFLTAQEKKDYLLRAQVSATDDQLEQIPLRAEGDPVVVLKTEGDIYDNGWSRHAGFAYQDKFRSLQKLEIFGRPDPSSDQDTSLSNCSVRALVGMDVTAEEEEEDLAQAEAFIILMDAILQTAAVPLAATFAPAKVTLQLHAPISAVLSSVQDKTSLVEVAVRYTAAASTRVDSLHTAYVNGKAVASVSLVLKPLPVAVGARFYPQFFGKNKFSHTLVCFHMAAGTSGSFEDLAGMLAPYGVRCLLVDFPHHGRRQQQTDDTLVDSIEGLVRDISPWLLHHLQRSDGSLQDFSLLGVSAGAGCAYELLHRCLLPAGLKPKALIPIMSQPPHVPNIHVERTYDATLDTIESIIGYYGVLVKKDLSHLNEGQPAVDRARSVSTVFRELTHLGQRDPLRHGLLDVPVYAFSLATDQVVKAEDVARWKEITTDRAWMTPRNGSDSFQLSVDKGYTHFLTLHGKAKEAFQEIFFGEHRLLDRIL